MLNQYQLNAVRNLVRPITPHLIAHNRLVKYLDNETGLDKTETQYYIQEQLKQKIISRIDTRNANVYKDVHQELRTIGESVAVRRAQVKDARKASPQSVINYLNYLTHHVRDGILEKVEPRLLELKAKFKNNEWQFIEWQKYGLTDNDKLRKLNELFTLHQIHYSIMSPMLIAYYPNLEHFRNGREVRTKLGKYLTQFKDEIGLTDLEIKSITEAHTARVQAQQGWEVRFIESNDPQGWISIYGQGERFNSCMTNSKAVQVYAHEKSVLKLAYMLEGGSVIARAIVRTQDNWDDPDTTQKGYVRIYPDPNGNAEGRFMLDTLKNLGYEKQTNLNGCLLKGIRNEDDKDVFMSPYIDYGNGGDQTGDIITLDDDGQTYIEIGSGGEYDLANTGGWTSNVETWTCDDCGDDVDEDDIEYVENADRHICQHCLNENYTWVIGRRGDEYFVENDYAIHASGRNYDEDYLSENDVYTCEDSGDLYHIDDLVMTSRGYIHNDIADPLDYEDSEGNSYAHKDDVHTLTNGRTCHEDNAEELQAEIDREEEEEKANNKTTTQGAEHENN